MPTQTIGETTRGVNGPWYALNMSERPPERVVIRGVKPELEWGRFPVKRVLGETVAVEADIFSYGHDALECVVRYRYEDDELWTEISMEALGNDHWRAQFPVDKLGQYIYTITAWIDPFRTWYQDLLTRIRADQDVTVDLQIGAEMLKPPVSARWAPMHGSFNMQHGIFELKMSTIASPRSRPGMPSGPGLPITAN